MKTDLELAKKYGLSDEQVEAMGNMGTMIPRGSIWRFRKNTQGEIRDLVEIYAEFFMDKTRKFVSALNTQNEKPELLKKANEELATLTRNAIKKDAIIERKLCEEKSQTTQTSTPQSERPCSST